MSNYWLIVTKGRAKGTLREEPLLPPGTLLDDFCMPLARCQRAQGPLKTFLRPKKNPSLSSRWTQRPAWGERGTAGHKVQGPTMLNHFRMNDLRARAGTALSGCFPVLAVLGNAGNAILCIMKDLANDEKESWN